jgi:hypothetical protein
MNPNGNGEGAVPVVPIGRVPTIIVVQQVAAEDGTTAVLLIVSTPVGQACHVLDADVAIETGQNLRQAGKASKAGLIVPGP